MKVLAWLLELIIVTTVGATLSLAVIFGVDLSRAHAAEIRLEEVTRTLNHVRTERHLRDLEDRADFAEAHLYNLRARLERQEQKQQP